MALDVRRLVPPEAIEVTIAPPRRTVLPIGERVRIKVVNVPNFQEATLRRVIQPKIETDVDLGEVRILSQGLTLSEERRQAGSEAILIEVAARYRRGEGSIKQVYRYLVFTENGTIYCQRLPMGSWPPADPDECLEWLGRGGLQQGDFVLLPRKRLPADCAEVPRPKKGSILDKAVSALQAFIGEALLDESVPASEWDRAIGRHDPVDCSLHRRDARYYLVAPHDTWSNHPEHAQLRLPQGVYEVVEDRATAFWRKAID